MYTFSWLLKLSAKFLFLIHKNLLGRPGLFHLGDAEKRLIGLSVQENHMVNKLNKNIKLYHWGSGPKILLIHGWGGRGLQLFPFINPLLDLGFSVTTLDFPAHGKSEGKTTSVFEFVITLKDILENQNFDGFISHSIGCASLLGALKNYKKLPPLVLFAPHFDLKKSMIEFMEKRGISKKLFLSFIKHYEKQYGILFDDFNPKDSAKNIESSVLIYHDEEDGALPKTHSENLSGAISQSKLIITKGLGHNRILKDDKITRDTIEFLKHNIEKH